MSNEVLSDAPFRTKKAWAITIRPKNGITDENIKEFPKWLSKHMFDNRLFAVTEMTGEKRHIHGVFLTVSNKDLRQDNLKRGINTVLKKSLGECWSKHTLALKYCYNSDWIEKYCAKEHKMNVIYDTLGNYDDFLPTAEEQLQAIKKSKSSIADSYFNNLSELWDEYKFEWKEEGHPLLWKVDAINFLSSMMYEHKRINVIRDRKSRIAIAECFRNYSRGEWNALDDLSKEERLLLELSEV